MSAPRVLVERDARAACARAADLIIEAARATSAGAGPGSFSLALSGGATPRQLYGMLSGPRSPEVPWDRLEFFFGDERCVPFDDPRSNFRMASECLLAPAGVPPERVHRMEGELPPDEGARRHEDLLRAHFGGGGAPRFGLILLGLGPDGHTASLFPGTPALYEMERWVVPNQAPIEPHQRLTLTLPVLNAARRVLFLVAGADKVDAARRALRDGDVPAARVDPARGELIFVLDEAAAAKL